MGGGADRHDPWRADPDAVLRRAVEVGIQADDPVAVLAAFEGWPFEGELRPGQVEILHRIVRWAALREGDAYRQLFEVGRGKLVDLGDGELPAPIERLDHIAPVWRRYRRMRTDEFAVLTRCDGPIHRFIEIYGGLSDDEGKREVAQALVAATREHPELVSGVWRSMRRFHDGGLLTRWVGSQLRDARRALGHADPQRMLSRAELHTVPEWRLPVKGALLLGLPLCFLGVTLAPAGLWLIPLWLLAVLGAIVASGPRVQGLYRRRFLGWCREHRVSPRDLLRQLYGAGFSGRRERILSQFDDLEPTYQFLCLVAESGEELATSGEGGTE